jgi:hypothetical protein
MGDQSVSYYIGYYGFFAVLIGAVGWWFWSRMTRPRQ